MTPLFDTQSTIYSFFHENNPRQHLYPSIMTLSETSPAAASYPPLNERPVKDTIVLFDVDGTLTPARRVSFLLLPSGLSFEDALVHEY